MENKLNLEIMTKLINMLKEGHQISEFNEENIEFNSKNYNFIKNCDSIEIICSNGRSLEISNRMNPVNWGYGQVNYYNTKLKYNFLDGDSLVINKNYANTILDNTINHDEFINYDIMFDDYKIGYVEKEEKMYHELIWNNDENRFNLKYGLNRHNDGYLYFNGVDKYILSKDLERIISINGKILPNREELNKFNLKEEQEKLNNIINNFQFNEITKEMILDLINNLKNKEKIVNQIIEAYDETIIPKSKEILIQENKFNKNIDSLVFSKEELLFILEVLNQMYVNIKENGKVKKL